MSDHNQEMLNPIFSSGHNTPPHLFVEDWFYMLTGATYKQQPIINNDARKKEWIKAFLSAAQIYRWNVIAWVVLDNHYHTILRSPAKNAANLPKFVASYHKFTARNWNAQEKLVGRMVWRNYWDTCIRTEQDFHNQ
jgi:REP element-mobilizing transposase RayT